MNQIIRALCLLTVVCLSGCGAPAGKTEKAPAGNVPAWTFFSQENGNLVSNKVLDVCYQPFPDGKSYLWVATEEGLARLNGDKWEAFTVESKTLLPSNVVRCVEVDPRVPSIVWFGCDGGLARFDGEKNQWMRYPGPSVRAITFQNQVLWTGTFGGIRKFDGNTWTDFTRKRSGLLADEINVMAVQTDSLWIGTNQGLNRYFDSRSYWDKFTGAHKVVDMISGNIRPMDGNSGLVQNQVYDLLVDGQEVWIATGGGLSRFSSANQTWTSYTADHVTWETRDGKRLERPVPGNSGLANNRILALETLNGRLAIGTIEGLNILKGTTWTLYNQKNSPLPSNRINCLELSPDGLWIGIENHGLAKVVF